MGKRGPKPGTAGNVTSISEVQKERPRPLPGMSKQAREVWQRIVDAYPPDHFKPQHLGMLRAYCETEHKYKQALSEVEKNGAVITQDNGVVKRNPWCQERDALSATMASLGTKLGITRNATTNTRDNAGNAEKPKSKRDGLMFNG